MQSEPAVESRTAGRGRRRKHGNGSAEGPVFVDTTGRRSKVLRRVGLLLGAGCLTYAVVLAAAFMGWGTSLTPSSLTPFGSADGGRAPGRTGPQGGTGRQAHLPDATPSTPASATATSPATTATPSATATSPATTATPSATGTPSAAADRPE
ncbi:hypothetical protein [Streptomyces sp. NPDC013455]|uniref:hypothetical protein n=1 Tax=Streptomyces sp. NPDC013455 TaxID=3155605 RepID=UPI0033ECF525